MDRLASGVSPRAIKGAIAAVAVIGAALIPWACGARQGDAQSALIRCRLDALKVLPEDPLSATVYDAIDVIERLRACKRQAADAGAPE
jgi:hypothetical protein